MVRAYRPDAIAAATIDRVVASGLSAPTAGNSRGVSVVVVTADETRLQIAGAAGEPGYAEKGFPRWLSVAPVHVVPCVSEGKYRDRYSEPDKRHSDPNAWGIPYWWVDAGAAMMGILLAAVDEGLVAGFLGEHAVAGLAEILGIPDDTSPIGVITLGYPSHTDNRRPESLDRASPAPRVHRERWGSD